MRVKVTRDSVKEQIFDVSHMATVKSKLKALLAGEMVPISDMFHDSEEKQTTVDDEGSVTHKLFLKDVITYICFAFFSAMLRWRLG